MTLSRRSAKLLLVSDEPQHLPNSKVLVRIAAKAQTGPCVRSAILWSQEDLWPITATCLMLRRMSTAMAQMPSGDCIEQCRMLEAKQKTYARTEFFSG
jgi:hypothetical protein